MKKYRITIQVNDGLNKGAVVTIELAAVNEERAKLLALSMIAEIDCTILDVAIIE